MRASPTTGTVRDMAAFDKPAGWFWSMVTQDGSTVVVRDLVG
jgi:hypothetical protein